MKVKIDVKQQQIKYARKSSGTSCPIALVVKTKILPGYKVYVGRFYVNFTRKRDNKKFDRQLPAKAADFVWDFDNMDRRSLEPISFSLAIPDEALKKSLRAK